MPEIGGAEGHPVFIEWHGRYAVASLDVSEPFEPPLIQWCWRRKKFHGWQPDHDAGVSLEEAMRQASKDAREHAVA